ncbi:MAG: arsenate reductase (glutaredoxin) [Woeseiaceae bacterium]|jgi:arsenate reductase (glutaredoxin)
MALTIYHNPRCSKSRQTLGLIREAGIEPVVIEYLKNPPGTNEIIAIAKQLGSGVAGLLRRGEEEFRQASDLPALDDDRALAAWLAEHPRVIQRPIVIDSASGAAVLGRPPENVSELLP